jgi:hypothetical protein
MPEYRDDEAATSVTGANDGGLQDAWKQVRMRLLARARLRRQQAMRARNLRLKYATPEQLAYADLLDIGVRIGRYFLAGTFILYVFGVTPTKIPLSELPAYWSMPADQYSRLVGVGTGWDWLTLIGYGDYMNFLGIAFLCGLTIACYLRVLPFSFERKDFVSGAVLVLEVILLSLAASGLQVVGHYG